MRRSEREGEKKVLATKEQESGDEKIRKGMEEGLWAEFGGGYACKKNIGTSSYT